MTEEFCRHLRPAKTMVVTLPHEPRGPAHLDRYQAGEVTVVAGMDEAIPERAVWEFAEGLDVVYMVETPYRDDVFDIFRAAGVTTVLHAMPELFRPYWRPDHVWLPTGWRADVIAHTNPQIVPVPVPTDRFRHGDILDNRARATRATFLHPVAPAMLDRNGTRTVLEALELVKTRVRVICTGAPADMVGVRRDVRNRLVDLQWRERIEDDRTRVYPDDAGCLLLPRRYAGLCLPMQEAAGLGWPIVTTDLPPQNEWVHRAGLVRAFKRGDRPMGGGRFDIFEADVTDLARAIDRIAGDPQLAAQAALEHSDWAEATSWNRWVERYVRLLAAACGK